ncbi:hypothetical protein [Nocardia takedensis]|uniref:hypothetical protein n=1 Tax=Nocardia takedensis TaxID=259390 RepID=UPI0002DEC208|nr:hypothetical protein [Nocardia takedensis]
MKTYGPVDDRPHKDPLEQTDREFFAGFAARTGLYIGYTDLRGVVTYLEGYDMASRRCGRPGLEGWREWLMTHHEVGSNLVWSAQIKQIALPEWDGGTPLSVEQEKLVLTPLFGLLDAFLAERESTPPPD